MFNELREKLASIWAGQKEALRARVFGVNNERLDLIMDTFYKLDPNQRNIAVGVGVGSLAGFIVLIFVLYFTQVSSLQKELNRSLFALRNLQEAKLVDEFEGERLEKLVAFVESRTGGFSAKPFFEKLSKDVKVKIASINERAVDLDPKNPLAKSIKSIQVDIAISKISIPRLLKFLSELEKARHLLRVQDLKVTGLYGDRLYFEAEILVRGYVKI